MNNILNKKLNKYMVNIISEYTLSIFYTKHFKDKCLDNMKSQLILIYHSLNYNKIFNYDKGYGMWSDIINFNNRRYNKRKGNYWEIV